MAQHDYVAANGSGAVVRGDFNDALLAVATMNSGATAPSVTYSYMPYVNTSDGHLYQRNAANTAWIDYGLFSERVLRTGDIGAGSGNIPAIGTKSATESLAGLVELATQAEAEAGTDDTVVMTALKTAQAIAALGSSITLGTAQATTSGTEHDFSIPSGTKRFSLNFEKISTNGSAAIIAQLGDSGGIETSGYAGSEQRSTGAASFSSGITLVGNPSSGSIVSGILLFELLDPSTNTWVATCNVGFVSSAEVYTVSGSKSLTGEITTARLTTANGTDVFDAGKVNVLIG
ncbi:hypothetical protein TH8_19535 [Thalassospira profundimaris]|nr:hypothetical protein TH8_19535 [Thalassospira profundimaris]